VPYFLTKDKKIESLADLPQGQYLILFFWTREPAIGYPIKNGAVTIPNLRQFYEVSRAVFEPSGLCISAVARTFGHTSTWR